MKPKRGSLDKDLPKKRLLRVDEAAIYFGVHERTVREWISTGKLEAIKPTGTIFILRESIKTFLSM